MRGENPHDGGKTNERSKTANRALVRFRALAGLVALGLLAVTLPPAMGAGSSPATAPVASSPVDALDGEDEIPPADAWRAAAEAGEAVPIVVDGERIKLDLAPQPSFLDHAPPVRGPDGDRLNLDRFHALAGTTADGEHPVRALVTDDSVHATLLGSPLGPVHVVPGEDGPAAVAPASAQATERAPFLSGPIDSSPAPATPSLGENPRGGDPDCLSLVPDPADPTGLADGWTARTFDVAFAVDGNFTERFDDWETRALHFVQSIDAIYDDAIDVRVSPVHVIVIPDGELPSEDTGGTLEDLQAYYDEHFPDLDREAVYLFSGEEFDNAAGQADCIGGAGHPDVAYAVGEARRSTTDFFGLTFLADVAVKVGAHELGHLLAAHHHYANCAESLPGYDPLEPLDACTMMINDWGLINPVFSTASRLAMRGHADAVNL